ncbi:MAG: lipase family protein [Hyphomicrobiaceae bacterium]
MCLVDCRGSGSRAFALFAVWALFFFSALFALTTSHAQKVHPSFSTLPYHPLVFHLDLSVLTYQLYSQTLVWPFDPYYESQSDRSKLMGKVRIWAKRIGGEQVASGVGLRGYRGPGDLNNFANNASHDPIVYRYDRLYPWSRSISFSGGQWNIYLSPGKITSQIRDVFMCYKIAKPRSTVAIEHVASKRGAQLPNARDILLAFEGGTGDKGVARQPASQSLMGFVLLRYWADSSDYDVHISFRGSLAGSALRAASQALGDDTARGNPDWITDLGWNPQSDGLISTTGTVSRGMAQSMASILPNLFGCLEHLSKLADGQPPKRIFVTGHSLGGGLAQHFVSAVLMGEQYGPAGERSSMARKLQVWPWDQIKLLTYSAPRVGDAKWARALTQKLPPHEFFSTMIYPYDHRALAADDPKILDQLGSLKSAAGYRILISTDPVTTEKGHTLDQVSAKHVGKTVYVDKNNLFSNPLTAHMPQTIRNLMLKLLGDSRIPTNVFHRLNEKDVDHVRRGDKSSDVADVEKRAIALQRYYRDNHVWFDHKSFKHDFELFRDEFLSGN